MFILIHKFSQLRPDFHEILRILEEQWNVIQTAHQLQTREQHAGGDGGVDDNEDNSAETSMDMDENVNVSHMLIGQSCTQVSHVSSLRNQWEARSALTPANCTAAAVAAMPPAIASQVGRSRSSRV